MKLTKTAWIGTLITKKLLLLGDVVPQTPYQVSVFRKITILLISARVVAQKPRFCHITPVLSDLHWLPVRHRISFKIATVTYRVLQFHQPSYLASLIPRYVPARALRSSSSLSICVPTRKTTMTASKSFSSVASGIWNALPNHLSSAPTLPVFRRALKHHLFLLAYPDSIANSGMIKPAQCISLRDTVPTTAIAQPADTMPPI